MKFFNNNFLITIITLKFKIKIKTILLLMSCIINAFLFNYRHFLFVSL